MALRHVPAVHHEAHDTGLPAEGLPLLIAISFFTSALGNGLSTGNWSALTKFCIVRLCPQARETGTTMGQVTDVILKAANPAMTLLAA